jgi:benzoate membrane transport protein
VGGISVALAWLLRIPLSFAWSTPGAALLLAAGSGSTSFSTAVGAFLACALLIVLCGLWPFLANAITSIPKPLATAMLAGILFPICLAPIQASVELPLLGLPIVATWLVLHRWAPRWAVPAAMAVAAVAVAMSAGTGWLESATIAPQLTFVAPAFDPTVMLSLGVPLFIVTMAGQNVPGVLVMSTFGYPVPARVALIGSGATSGLGALFGGHVINLAAITAALMASPEAHPDKDKRWVASFTAGIAYLVLGLGAGVATALVAASPPIIITAVAGLAVLGALTTSLTGALEDPHSRVAAIATFLVVASGIVVLGVGSAFWGLLVGAVVLVTLRRRVSA